MKAGRPIGFAIAWSATTFVAAAIVTTGPVLRPDVSVGPVAFAIGLSVAAAIAWPMLTGNRVAAVFAALQGGLMLALVGAASDSTWRATGLASAMWLASSALLMAGRAFATRVRCSSETVWAATLMTATVVTSGILASR